MGLFRFIKQMKKQNDTTGRQNTTIGTELEKVVVASVMLDRNAIAKNLRTVKANIL